MIPLEEPLNMEEPLKIEEPLNMEEPFNMVSLVVNGMVQATATCRHDDDRWPPKPPQTWLQRQESYIPKAPRLG